MQETVLQQILLGGEVLEALRTHIRPQVQVVGVFMPLQVVSGGEDFVTLLEGATIGHNYYLNQS